MLAGALTGVVVACQALDPQFIAGTGGKWIRPDNDYIAYLVAWHYYVIDTWRLPLLNLPAMGYPEGGSVLFNDALPLTAVPTKIIFQLSGVRLNPFGWWIFLTYVLQGAMAARVVCAVGVRSVWACTTAAVLTIVNTSFGSRMGHTALSSHFLLLWVLALHFESLRRGRAKVVESSVVLAVALLVNSYLFAMVFAFELATALALWVRGQLTLRDVRNGALGMTVSVLLGLMAGYGVFLANPTTMKAQGFGRVLVESRGPVAASRRRLRVSCRAVARCDTWPIRGRVLPRTRRPSATRAGDSPHAAEGGGVSSDVLGVRGHARCLRDLRCFEPGVCQQCSRASATALPSSLIDLGNYFRATGRFIWPLAYSLMILPVACIFRWWPSAAAIPVAVLASFLQIHEAGRVRMAPPPDRSAVRGYSLTHRAWKAGSPITIASGSTRRGRVAGSRGRSGRGEIAKPIVSCRSSSRRHALDCRPTACTRRVSSRAARRSSTWASNPQLEDGVLYLLGPEAVNASPALTSLARSNACITLDWGVVCSRKWLRMATDAAATAESTRR